VCRLLVIGGEGDDLPFAARCTGGSYAQETGFAKLRNLIALRDVTGPEPPLAGALDAAPQLHQTGHSRIAQQFFG